MFAPTLPLRQRLPLVHRWLAVVATASILIAGIPASAGPLRPLLYAAEGAQEVIQYDATGQEVWTHPAPMCRDASRLPNGNTLFCYNEAYDSKRHDNPSGVREVTPDHRVVFDFHTTGQVWSCQRLADGSTLVAAASQGRLLIVDRSGTVIRTIVLRSRGGHSCLRGARQLPDGHFLVAEEGEHHVREYAADGALVREIPVPFPPYSALRVAGGGTVICGQKTIVEVDPAGRTVWSLSAADVPQLGVRWFAGLQVLPHGHLLVCNAGGTVTFAEIDRDKRVVWQSAGAFPIGHGLQALDVPDPLR